MLMVELVADAPAHQERRECQTHPYQCNLVHCALRFSRLFVGGSLSAIFHLHKDRMIECATPPAQDLAAYSIAPLMLGAKALFAHCQNCQHIDLRTGYRETLTP